MKSKEHTRQSIQKWKEYGTTANLPRHGHPPKLTGQTRRALIRDAAKRSMVTLDELQRSTAQQELVTQMNQLNAQLQQISTRLEQLASLPPPVTNLPRPVRLAPPEKYSGETEQAQVTFMISHLATAEWAQGAAVCQSNQQFVQTLTRLFDHSSPAHEARALLGLRQKSRRVIDYAIEFRTLAADSGWNSPAIKDAFINRLNDIKDQLAPQETPAEFEDLVDLAIRITGFRRWSQNVATRRSSEPQGAPWFRREPHHEFRQSSVPSPPKAERVPSSGQEELMQSVETKSDLNPVPVLSNYPDLTRIPPCYHNLREVFNKTKAMSLPPHRPWDCLINLLPGALIPKARLYTISGPERKAMDDYIEASLRSGIIRPFSLPAGGGFFF
ncbi:hypothetical protein L3Q82_004490 [Scortum barcoo]|uniref:Uncharacterized protein n=1 Tax=Scortum barcoo TaxID=214431 RepID=A0ACB8VN49_9TELE|nr:hypothetical protein L3Q82_004490 [Scortum barcoo]